MNQNWVSQHCPETICRNFYINGRFSLSRSLFLSLSSSLFYKGYNGYVWWGKIGRKRGINAYCLRKAGLCQYFGETIQKQLIHVKTWSLKCHQGHRDPGWSLTHNEHHLHICKENWVVGYFYLMHLTASKLGKENAGRLCLYSISFHYPSCGVTKILAVPCLWDICEPCQGGS